MLMIILHQLKGLSGNMKSSLAKDMIRDIKNSLSRFISIVAIVAIGVGLFAGVKVSSPVMKNNADKYYDEQNFMDIQLVSTFGLTDDDVESIRNLKGVEGVFPTYSMDVLSNFDAVEVVLKVHGLDLNHLNKDDKDYINRPVLVDGRFPENINECVIEAEVLENYNLKIGDVIEVASGKEADISESLKEDKFTIVGTVHSPIYVSFQKGSSSIGSGQINGFILVANEAFKTPAYTEVLLTVEGAKGLQTYDKEYDETVEVISDKLEAVGIERSKIRYLEILAEAKDKIAESKEELQKAKDKSSEELAKAEIELKDAESKLTLGESELAGKEETYKVTIAGAEAKISEAEQKLSEGEATYNEQYEEFQNSKAEAEPKIAEAEKQIAEGEKAILAIESYIGEIKTEIANGNLTDEQKAIAEEKIQQLYGIVEQSKGGLESAKAELEAQKAMLTDGEKKLAEAKAELEAGKAELEIQKANFAKEKINAENQFESAKGELNSGRIEYNKGKETYIQSKADAEKQIAEAEDKIEDAEYKLNNLDEPEWYVLDRNTNYSYVDYENSANSINAIAQVFPVFFFIVAALVCLTTMTRMVDEQRGLMGTLKALGYSKIAIVSKYIVYAVAASLTGSLLGIAIGFTLFPTVIYNAYGIMYQLPKITLSFNWSYAIISTLAAILVTTGSALIACYKELVATPALLMRPKAPAMGKRILLERIPFIWNRLSFLNKVCARNIFRYKKRFLMTVIGVAGCTALLLTGYGIRDSIRAIVNVQFGELYHYDMTVSLDKNLRDKTYDKIINTVSNEADVEDYMMVNYSNIKVSNNETKKEAILFTPKDLTEFKDFITLRKRSNKEAINLTDDGVVLNEKLAKQLGVKVGDNVNLTNGDDDTNKKYEVKVIGITEQYIYHYIYITPGLYKQLFGEEPQFNDIIAKINDKTKEGENKLATDLINNDEIVSVSFNTSLKANFNDTIKSLNLVIIVMIISAGALAFVVLYNLTNVNISERIREIATIKVLGFYNNEVASYVYKENTLLTFIGMLVGLVLGVLLHRYIMVTVELDNIMFGRTIHFISYVWAAILTMMFGTLVNFVMYFKLKNVPMVESLKSVD